MSDIKKLLTIFNESTTSGSVAAGAGRGKRPADTIFAAEDSDCSSIETPNSPANFDLWKNSKLIGKQQNSHKKVAVNKTTMYPQLGESYNAPKDMDEFNDDDWAEWDAKVGRVGDRAKKKAKLDRHYNNIMGTSGLSDKAKKQTTDIYNKLKENEGVAEGSLNEFSTSGGGDGGDGELFALAKMWYNGDLETQHLVEKTLQRQGLDIGENEDENGGAYISDASGDHYESWTHADLEENRPLSGKDKRQWSNKDMERLRVATRDIDGILDAGGPDKIKQDIVKKRIKTNPMSGPKGYLPEEGVAAGVEKTIWVKPSSNHTLIVVKSSSPDIEAGEEYDEGDLNNYANNFGYKIKEQGVAEGLSDTQKKIEDTILKLEQRLKFAKTPEQWDRISARIERLQAGLNRSKQGVAEGSEITEEMIADRLKDELALFKSGTKAKDKAISKKPADKEVQPKKSTKKDSE